MNEQQKQRLDDAPDLYRGIVARAYGGKSRAAGMKAFCLQCTGYQRKEVERCSALACPLWPYRPYQHGDEPEGEE